MSQFPRTRQIRRSNNDRQGAQSHRPEKAPVHRLLHGLHHLLHHDVSAAGVQRQGPGVRGTGTRRILGQHSIPHYFFVEDYQLASKLLFFAFSI